MNSAQDAFALMGCGVALLVTWHMVRTAKGPQRFRRVGTFHGWTLSVDTSKFAAASRRAAAAIATFADSVGRGRR